MILLYIVNNSGKKFAAIILTIVFLIGLLPAVNAAGESVVEIRFEVSERNSVKVTDFLMTRGVPFCRGEVSADDTFTLTDLDSNTKIPVQTAPMQFYDDGSVQWLKFSYLQDLEPNQTKKYILKKEKNEVTTDLVVTNANNSVSVKNSVLSVDIGGFGIEKLLYGNIAVLADEGITLECLTGSERPLNKGTVEIVESGCVYTKIKVTGVLAETNMKTEQLYTILARSNKIISEARFMASGDTLLKGLVQTVNLKETFNSETHQNTNYVASGKNPMYSCGRMSVYSESDNLCFNMISREPDIFRGAVSKTVSNGFRFEMEKSRLLFAPIHYETEYTWLDGVNRTAYSEMIISAGKSKNYEENLLTLENTPAVKFTENPFVRAGIILSDSMPVISKLQIDGVKWLKDKRNGRMDAGSIPYGVDPDHDLWVSKNARPGEVEYNCWFAQMMSGDAMLFDIVNESTQSWADTNIYKGKNEWLIGANRYRSDFNHQNFEISQPYYGDNSGLYMGYLLTGNEYYKEMVELTADYYVRVATTYPSHGYTVPRPIDFRNGTVKPMSNVEIRYMMTTRALYYSHKLLGKKEYTDIMNAQLAWAKAWQHPEGYWLQAWDDGKGPYDFYMKKNYIMLYGMRGVCEVYNETKNTVAKEMLINFADYLITEMDPESGWMWDPHKGTTPNIVNEGNERGNSPFQEGMAAEVFETVYNITKEEKYLNAMLKLLRYYLGSTQKSSGFVSVRFCAPEYLDGFINSVVCGQASTMVKNAPLMQRTISENEELVRKLGFEDLYDYYCNGAENITGSIVNPYDDFEVTLHAFKKDNRKNIYIVNHSGANSGNWKKDISINMEDGYIYEGMENEITSQYSNKIKATLDMFEMSVAKSIPIKVISQISPVSIKVVTYSEKEVVLDIVSDSGDVKLSVEDGPFRIYPHGKYNFITENAPDGYTRLKITKAGACGNLTASENSKLDVTLNFGLGAELFSDVGNHWCKDSVESLLMNNVLELNDEKLFYPEETISVYEYIELVSKAAMLEESIKLMFKNEFSDGVLTREDMAAITIRAAESAGKKINLAKLGVYFEEALIPANYEKDEDAVKADVEKIKIPDVVKSNIALSDSGLYGSTIAWESSVPETVSDSGVIRRPQSGEGDKKVTLTARVSRGNYTSEKKFNITVADKSYVNFTSMASATEAVYSIKKVADKISFTAKANEDITDYVIGHICKVNGFSANQDMPIIVRFNPNGMIDAYNYDTYQSETELKYSKDKEFKFDIAIDYKKRIYNVTATDEEGNIYVIAKDYRFRATAKDLSYIDAVVSTSAAGNGLGEIIIHSNGDAFDSDIPVKSNPFEGYTLGNVILNQMRNGDTLKWYSLDADIADNNGVIKKHPDNDAKIRFMAIPVKLNVFTDISDVSQGKIEDVLKCGCVRFINMNLNEFKPKAFATHAEAATVLQRLNAFVNK